MKISCLMTLLISSLLIFPLAAINGDSGNMSQCPSVSAEKDDTPADSGFGSLGLPELSEADKHYLGLKDNAKPVLKDVDADLIIFEFLSIYCPSCQRQAPIFNELYSAITEDDSLRSRMKMIGLDCGPARLPLRNPSDEQIGQIREGLEAMGFFKDRA